MSETKMRICKHCYNLFEITLNHEMQLYCSRECHYEEKLKRARAKYAEDKKIKAEKTNNFLKKCEFCGSEFHASQKTYGKTKFCSVECRNNYYKSDEYKNSVAMREGRPIYRKAKSNSPGKICVLANAEGLTYGQYVAKYGL